MFITNLLAASALLAWVFSPLLLKSTAFGENLAPSGRQDFHFQEPPGVGISGYARTVDGQGVIC